MRDCKNAYTPEDGTAVPKHGACYRVDTSSDDYRLSLPVCTVPRRACRRSDGWDTLIL
jgi:hypothetical protein